jgi:hypothetical protein
MKTRSHLLLLSLFALATVTGAEEQAAGGKRADATPATGRDIGKNSQLGSEKGGALTGKPNSGSAAGPGDSVPSDPAEEINQLRSSDAKLSETDAKLQKISDLYERLGTIRLLLLLVLGLTSFIFIMMAWSLYSRQKARGQPRPSPSSNDVLLQKIDDLRNRINDLSSEIKSSSRWEDKDHKAKKSGAVTTSLYEEERPAPFFGERPSSSPASIFGERPSSSPASIFEERPSSSPASIFEERPSSSPASIFEERLLTSSAPVLGKWSTASPDPEPCFSEPSVVRGSFNDDPSILVRARDMGSNFREAILQNGGKFQAGWETFKRSLPREIETEDVWYDLAANEKVLTFQSARMGNAVHCRVVIIESQEHGRRGLLFISHIGEFYPRIEDFPFCDVRADGPVQRDRLLSYLPPVVTYIPGRRGWEVTRKGAIVYY